MDLAFTPKSRPSARKSAPGFKPICPRKSPTGAQRPAPDPRRYAGLGQDSGQKAGWPLAGPRSLAAPAGRPYKSTCLKKSALAGAPRIIPFGPVMVAPVIMAFGNAEQQKRFLPGIASGEVWWSQGYSEPGGLGPGQRQDPRRARGRQVHRQRPKDPGPPWGQHGDWMFNLVRTSTEGKLQTGISSCWWT